MGLDAIFFILFLLFLIGLIFFIVKKPKIIARWQAVLLCLVGMLAYGILFGLICYDEFDVSNNIVKNEISNSNKISKNVTSDINTNDISKKDIKQDAKSTDTNGSIIGDVDSKIYHVPGSTYYKKELQKKSNNIYFKTVEEAEKAGYRAPKK